MKLQFKHQQFQTDAANAVCDIFAGQPMAEPFRYILDTGKDRNQLDLEVSAFGNRKLELKPDDIWAAVHKKQTALGLKPTPPSDEINLTVEMETGTGKTYTYIKTMYELNKRYGWSKFIIVVPSIAIREGVKKSFEITREHFKQEYGKSIIEFVYNSSNLAEIETFATDNKIRVMIINSQAFAASLKEPEEGKRAVKESRIIFSEQDKFKGRCPIDVIAKTNPVLILDEPQSLGRTAETATQKSLKLFNALFRLQYSATPPELNKNIIYRLDAQDAYNKKLVKKIAVKGISTSGDSATGGYAYLSGINVAVGKNPTASLGFDMRGAKDIRTTTRICEEGDNLYELSGSLDEYRDGWLITSIDGRTNSVRFQNGREICAGEVIGKADDEQLRRIQIRETIVSHFEREQALFERGIKVLSLFFIDKVANYRSPDDGADENMNDAEKVDYAKMFEGEYDAAKNDLIGRRELWPKYQDFLENTNAATAHQGYFSINKKSGKFKDSEIKRGANDSDDTDAYDLIMKDKERLLDRAEPVRFIFSHSALREGWDNPNVFQICTLKQSTNDTSRRQEIGRGLRLSVNQSGERMDESVLGEDVQKVNVLTVIASVSYEKFVSELQKDIAAAMSERPREVSAELFVGRIVDGASITKEQAQGINDYLIKAGYVERSKLTEKYHADVEAGTFAAPEGFKPEAIVELINVIYTPILENARGNIVELKLDEEKFRREEFQALWKQINIKSAYRVIFASEELIEKSISALDSKLRVAELTAVIKTGEMDSIESKDALERCESFAATSQRRETINVGRATGVKYDLIDKLVQGTGLTRKTLAAIMSGIIPDVFKQFSQNPEDFIMRAVDIINEQKATAIVEHIEYNRLESTYDTSIFTEPNLKKGTRENAVETPRKHIYSHVIADSGSKPETDFAKALEISEEVVIYAKLPRGFYISTPVGKYNPDWAIVLNEGAVKHIYFVAETKGSMNSLELRGIEDAKIACARKHFKAISSGNVKYDVVTDYESLLRVVRE